MKILYVGHTYTVRANHPKIAALARAMPEAQITLVTPHAWRGPLYKNTSDRFDAAMAPNVTHNILPAYRIGREGTYFFGLALIRLIAKLKPDIVHVEQGAWALSYAEILLALKLLSPHSRAIFFTWWNLPYEPQGLKRISETFNLSHSSCAIAGNEAARAILRDHGFQRPVHVLPQLGVESTLAAAMITPGKTPFTIGYAGRITPEKGVLDLVDATAEMQSGSAALYFVGEGEALPEVKRRAAYHGVSFSHHPAVKNDELPAELEKMDILVLPSRTTAGWVEQFGHILLEAMAMGIPVIGSSSGEIPNVIGDAGLVFPEGDIHALAIQLTRVASSDSERARLSAAGRNRVGQHFTNDIIAREQSRIYEWMMLEGMPVGSAGKPARQRDLRMRSVGGVG